MFISPSLLTVLIWVQVTVQLPVTIAWNYMNMKGNKKLKLKEKYIQLDAYKERKENTQRDGTAAPEQNTNICSTSISTLASSDINYQAWHEL